MASAQLFITRPEIQRAYLALDRREGDIAPSSIRGTRPLRECESLLGRRDHEDSWYARVLL